MEKVILDCSGSLKMHPQVSIQTVEYTYKDIETIIEELDKYFIQELFIMVVLFLSQKYISVRH